MNSKACATPGCFNTAYGSEYCSACLYGRTPEKRGPVTYREAIYARLRGGEDEAITQARLLRHSQPVEILARRSLPNTIYAEVARRAQLDFEKVAKRVSPQKIFISYAKEDLHRAEELYSAFSARGHAPWMDKKNLLPGQRWKLEISRAMKSADYCVVCLSRTSVNKTGYFQKEIRLAIEQLDLRPEGKIYAVPVRYDDCEIPDLLKDLHVLDMTSQDALGQLAQAIEVAAEAKA